MPSLARSAVITFTCALGLLAAPLRAQTTLNWGVGGAGGSGTWSTSTSIVDWYNGTANVPWTNGDNAVFAGTAGTVSISGSVTTPQVTFSTAGYTIQNFFLVGGTAGLTVETDADATISSSIFGTGNSTPFYKTGSGALILPGGGPDFFSGVTINGGELRYSGAASTAGDYIYTLANVAGVALTLGSGENDIDSLSGGGTSGGVVRPNVTTGSLNLGLYGSGNASFAGAIQDNGSATLALQKSGAGYQTLAGANTFSGATTVNRGTLALAGANGALLNTASLTVNSGGTLLLDNSSASNGNRLASGVAVNLSGGTLSLVGNATTDTTQTMGALKFSNASAVTVTPAGSTAAQLVFSGGLTRQNNGTISFSDGGHVTVTGLTTANGIAAPYITVNGTDWASADANGRVSAYTGYTSSLASAASTDNLRVASSGGTTALGQTQSRNSLDLVTTGTTAATLDLGAGQTLSLTSGGLLASGSAGQTVQNGTLKPVASELIITNQNALTVSSIIANGSGATTLTKSGAGTLALTGTNTYTGPTTVVQGTVQAAADANLGAANAVALSGGTLQATASFTSAKSLQGTSGTVDTNGYNVAFNGGVNTNYLTKTGAGMLSLTGIVYSASVNAGTLRLTNLSANNSADVYLYGGRLESSGSGISTVVSEGASPEIAPGGIGQAASLTLGALYVYGPTVMDFDLGSSAKDAVAFSSSLVFSGSQLLFRFTDLGGTQTGTAYTLLTLSNNNFGVSVSNFGIDPASTAAGYKGTFTFANNVLSVSFTAVPEPGAWVWLLGAAAAGGMAWKRRA